MVDVVRLDAKTAHAIMKGLALKAIEDGGIANVLGYEVIPRTFKMKWLGPLKRRVEFDLDNATDILVAKAVEARMTVLSPLGERAEVTVEANGDGRVYVVHVRGRIPVPEILKHLECKARRTCPKDEYYAMTKWWRWVECLEKGGSPKSCDLMMEVETYLAYGMLLYLATSGVDP